MFTKVSIIFAVVAFASAGYLEPAPVLNYHVAPAPVVTYTSPAITKTEFIPGSYSSSYRSDVITPRIKYIETPGFHITVPQPTITVAKIAPVAPIAPPLPIAPEPFVIAPAPLLPPPLPLEKIQHLVQEPLPLAKIGHVAPAPLAHVEHIAPAPLAVAPAPFPLGKFGAHLPGGLAFGHGYGHF